MLWGIVVLLGTMRVEGKKAISSKSCQFGNMNRSHVDLGWVCWTRSNGNLTKRMVTRLPNGYFVGVIKCNFACYIMHISYPAYNPAEE